ncbi:MAG: bacillithiol biosynthesis deacetylase BshB1 [Rhodothermaceae bacterium]
MKLDVVAFGAHPDDVEMGMGGTIAKLIRQGMDVGIVDFTQGETATRGTKETRTAESMAASEILGLKCRENLKLPDGQIRPDKNYVMEIVKMIRKYKPEIIFATYYHDRHPDHEGAGQIVKEAMFLAGLPKVETTCDGEEQKAYRPKKLFFYMMTYDFEPSFIVDISDTFETKMESIKAYKTQVFDPNSKEPETLISQPAFFKMFEARARNYGFKIRKEFGEAFFAEENIELDLSSYINKLSS